MLRFYDDEEVELRKIYSQAKEVPEYKEPDYEYYILIPKLTNENTANYEEVESLKINILPIVIPKEKDIKTIKIKIYLEE